MTYALLKKPTHEYSWTRTRVNGPSLSERIKIDNPSPLNLMIQRNPTCACGGSCPRCKMRELDKKFSFLTKLKISEPGDKYEREADQISDSVIRAPINPIGVQVFQKTGLKKTIKCSRQSQGNLQMGSGNPLSESDKRFFESRFGYDFGDVRVHTDNVAQQAAHKLHSLAFTIGHDIVFGEGNYQPHTQCGMRLLAHELTHVIQQSYDDSSDGNRKHYSGISFVPLGYIQRQRIDTETCDANSVTRFRETHFRAIDWIEFALRLLRRPRTVRSYLWRHFEANPDDAEINTIRANLSRMLHALRDETNTYFCSPDITCRVEIGRDRNNNPIYRGGFVPPGKPTDIHFCQYMLFTPLDSRVRLLVHETVHTEPTTIPDGPYIMQASYPGPNPSNLNAESYSSFIEEVWINLHRSGD